MLSVQAIFYAIKIFIHSLVPGAVSLHAYHIPMLLEAHAVHALQSLLKPLKLLQPLINSTL